LFCTIVDTGHALPAFATNADSVRNFIRAEFMRASNQVMCMAFLQLVSGCIAR
jgi:hypothetical protein